MKNKYKYGFTYNAKPDKLKIQDITKEILIGTSFVLVIYAIIVIVL